MNLKKARIRIYEDTKREKFDENNDLIVHFNPSEYSLDFSASYTEKSAFGSHDPITQFIAGQSHSLSMTLYFDTYTGYALTGNFRSNNENKEDVRKYTNKLISLVQIKGDLHTPPPCGFIWGGLHFDGYIESLKQTFTMFTSDGKPVRAKVDITFKSLQSLDSRMKEPLQSPDRTKQRVLTMNMQLWELASDEYDDPGMWRVIAKENAIKNPRELNSGMVLKLPAL